MSEKLYLRVTEVLAPFSGLDRIDPAVLQNAADRGTRVHKACEAIVEGLGEWEIDEEIQGYVSSFKKWWGCGHSVASMEERFFCDDLEITGQVDLILNSPDGHIILDIKTPAKPSKTWPLQGSAYYWMASKSGYNPSKIQFLKLSKEGKDPKIHEYEYDIELFKNCLNVFNHFYRRNDHGATHQDHLRRSLSQHV